MPSFSQRKGITPLVKLIQRESLDDDLKNSLWNAITVALWNQRLPRSPISRYQSDEGKTIEAIARAVWQDYFKLPLDTCPPFHDKYQKSAYEIIREHFYTGEWWETYNLLEFLIKITPLVWTEELKETVNIALQSENAAYRVVGDEIVDITDEHELEAIETALDQGITQSHLHLSRSLELLSDRKQPDYRNSIKESISAVEAVSQMISGKPKATLGECIKVIKTNGAIHPAFEQTLLKLYGYTSDEGGIRHALTEDSTMPSYADAKFMLVSCAAFINFLLTKAAEIGLAIQKK